MNNDKQEKIYPFELSPLPYASNALDRVISPNTISFHHGKHHKAYVDNLNMLIADTEFKSMSLDKIISRTEGKSDKAAIFNNAAQVWNHEFYWKSLTPKGGGEPPAVLMVKIEESFGSVDSLKKELSNAAITQFGSGWAWLVEEKNKLKVIRTSNAGMPQIKYVKPLLTIDVWEHAYYLDYQNKRADYVNALIENLICWDFAVENLC